MAKIRFASGSGKNDLKFIYDAMDRRVAKLEYVSPVHDKVEYTWYGYDASGNVMATYERIISYAGTEGTVNKYADVFVLNEQYIYGASRLGTKNEGQQLTTAVISQPVGNGVDAEKQIAFSWSNVVHREIDRSYRKVGDKYYELSNHLGNVLEVITDRKLAAPEESHAVLDLDAAQYIDAGTSNRGMGTQITLEGWVKTTQYAALNAVIFSKYSSNDRAIVLYLMSTGKALLGGRNGAGAFRSSGQSATVINDGQWHHVAGVIDGDNWKIYVDGVLESGWTGTNSSPAYDPTGIMYIGSCAPAMGNAGYEGELREARWWKTARSASELNATMYGPLSGSETDLVGYWPLDEGSGTSVTDQVLNVSNTITGGYANWSQAVLPFGNGLYMADVVSYSDYYPYGMLMPGRHGSEAMDKYRYGFQGQEMDDEIKGRRE